MKPLTEDLIHGFRRELEAMIEVADAYAEVRCGRQMMSWQRSKSND